jgi:hypothetical protein
LNLGLWVHADGAQQVDRGASQGECEHQPAIHARILQAAISLDRNLLVEAFNVRRNA